MACNNNNLSINNRIIAFMSGCLVFGFLLVGMASAGATELNTGRFTDKSYAINGGWSIETRGDQHVIKFDQDFSTKGGPDLKVFLSPRALESVQGSNATQKAEFVAKLRRSSGEQEYVLPQGIDPADYRSLLIHCEAFGVLWGGSNLAHGT